MQQMKGEHGATAGHGMICVPQGTKAVYVEYRYHKGDDGTFHGSVSTWNHESDGAGLVAYLSRALPDRKAVLDWIFAKAEKLTQEG